MEFREMIETAATQAGSIRALAIKINVRDANLTAAKYGKRPIPDEACALLAQLLELDFGDVIQARNLATAKTEAERNFWSPFVHQKAAAWLITIASSAFFGIAAPNNAHANDTFKVSTTTPQAAPLSKTNICLMYIMSNSAFKWVKGKAASALDTLLACLPRFGFAGL